MKYYTLILQGRVLCVKCYKNELHQNIPMTNIQAHFTDKTTAEKARTTLVESGVAKERVHIWNDLDGSAPFAANRDDASEGGALLGGLLAGATGLAAGAAIGSTYESGASSSASSFGAPNSGVRLVVENENDENGAIEAQLKAAGATNVQRGE